MLGWLKTGRQRLVTVTAELQQFHSSKLPFVISFGYFVFAQLAILATRILTFFVEIPLHLKYRSSDLFSAIALRDNQRTYLESYNSFQRRGKLSFVTIAIFTISIVAQFSLASYSLYRIGRATKVEAYSTSVTLNPTYDISGSAIQSYIDDGFGNCTPDTISYSCDGSSLTSLKAGGQLHSFVDCSAGGYNDTDFASTMKFDFSSIPSNATITSAQLTINVTTTTSASINLVRSITDDASAVSCNNAFLDVENSSRFYQSALSWSSIGSKTYSLGSSGVADIQSQLGTTKIISLGFSGDLSNRSGLYSSSESASNKPQLVISYTLPPQAPTSANHTSITTSSVTWTWTDNATADTSNRIHDASHTVMCTTGAIASTGSTGSCTETGLSANTQYTRHPNVLDANGNTDGPSATAYTSIEDPSGVSFSGVTSTSITAASSTTLSNLSSGSSGVYIQNTTSNTNSGWLTANSWTTSGLTPNTQYSFQVKARNGDAIETALSSTASVYTLPATANISSTRATATWYTTAPFPFTNTAGWGSTGVQYYRYVWDQLPTHTFTGAEPTWSDADAHCPGSVCTTAATTLTVQATTDSAAWYLHALPYNAADVANGAGSNIGPYYYDATAPTSISSVADGLGADENTTSSTSVLSANWTSSTDATSGLALYQYAIGTTIGGSDIVAWTNVGSATHVTVTGLTLRVQSTYYFSVRALDMAGNVSAVSSSNGTTITGAASPSTEPTPGPSTAALTTPVFTNWHTGDTTADTTPLIAGTGPINSGIFILVDRVLVRTVPVDASGHFLVDLRTPLSLGQHALVVRAKQRVGVTSEESAPITISVVSGSTGTTIISRTIQSKTTPSVRFVAEAPAASTVHVALDGSVIKTITTPIATSGTSRFTTTITPSKNLSTGNHVISFVTSDAAGTPSAPTGVTWFTKYTETTVRYGQTMSYTVVAGDSLWSIAKTFLGNGARWTEIQRLNATSHPSLLTSPSSVSAGWTVHLPSASAR